MEAIPLSALFWTLGLLIILSGFFSGSETALMTLNRYRLRNQVQAGYRGARFAERLLQRPDRLLGLILLCNNFVNIAASALATIIALRLGGEAAIAIATGLLTLVILIFAEVAPKTLAAIHPERLAYPAAYVYTPLIRLLYPVIWLVNLVANTLLRPFGIRPEVARDDALSPDELRTVVAEAGRLIPKRHQNMLISILDLEQATVEDIMVPRNEIAGIDLEDPWEEIIEELTNSQHTRLPVYRENIDDIVGILHTRRVLNAIARGELNRAKLEDIVREPYFIPENTPLHRQLINFQNTQRRIGLVVDEYGDIQGLVTLEDILEEIVGEFTTDPMATRVKGIVEEEDGNYMVTGTLHLRTINRVLGLDLPTDGPKTINGLILEYMETIPEPGTSLRIADYPMEIIQSSASAVRTVRIKPRLTPATPVEED
ncbi:HlyC/CorC family transporter [Natronospira bacteriovora]|uniref:HlyC/CorC family transporter n=1 Tax=Natronospira bacteriovora TaxID=3069753 RepID=A0ABU0W777_9GAMM|nr:HlyC/CorC family transporter [Natronospira sp. AB-CW4]MDQ2068850.1 HlyC/CorC family transporter [Natronospira sp. AB-CW4]